MTLLMGYNEGEERMKRETLSPAPRVAIDKDFYTNNHEAASRKRKEVEDEMKPSGDERGYNAKIKPKYAIGGVVKERRGFYD